MTEWVKITDKLPDRDGPVLVFIPTADPDKPFIYMAWYDPGKDFWSFLTEFWVPHITHWMPLPGWPEDYKKEVSDVAVGNG